MQAHAAVAATHLPQEMMDAVLADWQTAVVPERTRAALHLLECITLRPLEIDAEFVDRLHKDGLDDAAIHGVASVSFHFNMLNRFADSFDFPLLNVEQEALQTKMLNQAGRMKGKQADPIWTKGFDGQIRPTELAIAREAILTLPGKTLPELRQAVEAFVVIQRGHTRADAPPLPEELTRYFKKLALSAYKIIDKDVNVLREAGYEDEAIYELTVAGAVGAALVGVEKLFNVLHSGE